MSDGDLPAPTPASSSSGSRRVRLLALLLPVVVGATAFLAWSQPWVVVTLADERLVTAAGDAAAPAVPPLALAALALVGALALAGPVFRVLLGLLQSALGLGIAVSGLLAIGDPIAAAAARITETTGIAGDAAVRALVAETVLTPWPGVAIAAGAAGILVGLLIAATASRWPPRTRRYDAVRMAPVEGSGHGARLDAWDALSDGDDPTAR
jgi:Tryptophan-associated transmembrane protein (Trp_oprn_chp)